MSRTDTALLVVDVQDKLMRLIPDEQRIVWNIRRLIDGAKILGLRVLASEQYPQGLGPTNSKLASRLGPIPDKLSFSCGGCREVVRQIREANVYKILVCGIEAHVCVQQTTLDLLSNGFSIYLAVDAIGSRHPIDRETALGRMNSAGAILTTTEAALFEWCEAAGTPEFKQISQLVKEDAGT